MIAIVLAAGLGKRLGNLTAENTKCMLDVGGAKIIDRLIDSLLVLNLKKIVIVTGHGASNLESYVVNKYIGQTIEFVYNKRYKETNNIYSLSLVKDLLIENDAIVLESDIVFENGILKNVLETPHANICVVAPYEFWMNGTVVNMDQNNYITNLTSCSTLNQSDVNSWFKTVNIYKFSKEFSTNKFVPFLTAYITAFGENQFYEQVLNVLSLGGKSDIYCLILKEHKWYEIDNSQDLNTARLLFDETNALVNYQQRYGGYWAFPKLVDFCYLVNPYFPTEEVKSKFRAISDTLITSYPSGQTSQQQLTSGLLKVKSEYICVGNGGAELIKVLFEILPKKKIGTIVPTFEEYLTCIEPDKVIPYYSVNNEYKYTVDDLINFYSVHDISTLIIINPDNPTGNFLDHTQLTSLLTWTLEKDITVIVDESFLDFSDHPQGNTLLSDDVLLNYPNLIVIKSISKSYGIPGIRLGALATSNVMVLTKVKDSLPIWNINSFAEFFLQIIQSHEESFKQSCLAYRQEKERFFLELQKIFYLRIYPSQANFFLCDIHLPLSSTELAELLLKKFNILIKDCVNKKGISGSKTFRVAIRDQVDNEKLISALIYIGQKHLISAKSKIISN